MRRIFALAVGVILLLGGLVGTSAASTPRTASAASHPLSAAAAPSGCTSGNFCFWASTGYSDGPGKLSGKNSAWSAFSHSSCPSGTWDNCASSDYNNGVSCVAVVWTGNSYTGSEGVVDRGTGGNFSSTFNNAVSSNSWATPTYGTNSTCTGPV